VWPRRKPFRFLCPYCGGIFFRIEAGLVRKRNKLPAITSMNGLLSCASCGLGTGYDDFVRQHRGWL
jgi:hypothetical protein